MSDSTVNDVAVSVDGGETWTTHRAPDRHAWVSAERSPLVIDRWVEPLAWDGRGQLFSFWGDSAGVWLARSADRGATWATRRVAECDAPPCYFPYLIARGDGDLAATWMSGTANGLRWHVARISTPHASEDAAGARVALSPPLELDAWLPAPASASDTTRPPELQRDTGGEYVQVAFLADGALGLATPVQGPVRTGFTWWQFVQR